MRTMDMRTMGGSATNDVEVRNLVKGYEGVPVLHDVSFTIRRREVVALVGESGSGKSTIARLLARLMPPSEGKILFKGRDVLAEEPHRASLAYRRQVQRICQDPVGARSPSQSGSSRTPRLEQ